MGGSGPYQRKERHFSPSPSLLAPHRPALALPLIQQKCVKEEGGSEGAAEGKEDEACYHTGIDSRKEDEEMGNDFGGRGRGRKGGRAKGRTSAGGGVGGDRDVGVSPLSGGGGAK